VDSTGLHPSEELRVATKTFNKIGEKGRTGSAWKQERWRGRGQRREMAPTMSAHMNK
jgi:hypothetical protein